MKSADVFVLTGPDGVLLPPAVQATVLAKYSRSPDSARELLKKVSPEDAASFQEKWGLTYGHSSIAELATVPYCFEGVSIIASKFLERNQRAGYSEKSTRYQVFSEESFVEPAGAPAELREIAALLYRTYRELEPFVTEYVASLMGSEGVSIRETMKKPVVKARAFDSLRYLLPAGTGTNLTAVLNARDARYVMSDLLGSTLPELRDIGTKMVEAAHAFAPVFALGAKPNTFEPKIRSLGPTSEGTSTAWCQEKPQVNGIGPWACLVDPVPTTSGSPVIPSVEQAFWDRVRDWYEMTRDEFTAHMETRGKHQVPEVFKTVRVTFDICMDYGAFRDLQRHRRCEQYIEPLSLRYGYEVPDDLVGPHRAKYCRVMNEVIARCSALLDAGIDPEVIQYALPLGTLHRSKFEMDLRELYYLTELRTQPQGHISYRRVAWQMVQEAQRVFPSLMTWCRAIKPEGVQAHH